MPQPLFLLSENDRDLVRGLLNSERNRLRNTPNRPGVDLPEGFAPEVYVATAPGGGIPALSGVTPGSATCAIGRLNSAGVLESAGFTKVIYNLSTSAIAGSSLILVERDKFGTWYAGGSGGGGVAGFSGAKALGDASQAAHIFGTDFPYQLVPVSAEFDTGYGTQPFVVPSDDVYQISANLLAQWKGIAGFGPLFALIVEINGTPSDYAGDFFTPLYTLGSANPAPLYYGEQLVFSMPYQLVAGDEVVFKVSSVSLSGSLEVYFLNISYSVVKISIPLGSTTHIEVI